MYLARFQGSSAVVGMLSLPAPQRASSFRRLAVRSGAHQPSASTLMRLALCSIAILVACAKEGDTTARTGCVCRVVVAAAVGKDTHGGGESVHCVRPAVPLDARA
jgi:hypothetical protein